MQNQVSNNWQITTLGGTATLNYGEGLPERNRHQGGVPVYGSSGVTGCHNQPLVNEPGYIIGRKGNVGSIYYSPQPFFPIDTTYFVTKSDIRCDFDFFYYILKTLKLDKLDSDSAVPGLNRETAYVQKVLLPTVPEQQRIASTLSAFDDKIEVNNKIARTLEEMAQIIFKEWIEKNKNDKWKVGKLSDIANITMGQSPPSKFYNQNGSGLPFHQGVTNFGERYVSIHDTYCSIKGRIANEGDILLSVRAPVGRINIADCKIVVGRGLSAIRHNQDLQSFLFYLLKRIFRKEDSIGSGSVYAAVNKDELNNIEILIPDDVIMQKFENMASNYDKRILMIYRENQKLAKMRDLLLPKLMRGEIGV